MEIINSIAKAIRLTDYNGFVSTFGDIFIKKGNTSYVASCLNTMGNYISKAKFRLYKKRKNNGKLRNYEIYEHPFLELWNKPNEFQTNWELKYFIGLYLATFGNYYLLALKGLASGKPRALIMLDPSRVEPIAGKTKYIDHYEYDLGTEKVKLNTDEVIHIRYPNKGSLIKGVGIIDDLKDVIDTDRLQQSLTKKFYKEGGFMGLAFTTNAALGREVFDRTRQMLAERYGGENNAFKVALFEQGLQPIKSPYSIKDMDITNQRKLTQEEVLMAFRIPKILLGGSAEGYTKASAEAAEYTYAQSMIDPILNYVGEVFSNFIRQNYGDEYVFKHDSIAPKDVERMLEYYKVLAGLGSISIEEIREQEDFEPFNFELTQIPLLNVGGAVIRIDTGEQLGSVPNNRINNVSQDENKSFDEQIITKNLQEEIYELHYKQYNRRFEAEVFKINREIEKFFDGQKKRLLDFYDMKNTPLIEAFFNGEVQILVNMFENLYLRSIEQGMKFGGAVDKNNYMIREALSRFIENSKNINETSKKEILNAIKDASEDEIRKIIEEKFKSFRENRSKIISSTVYEGGFNLGLFVSYKLKGYSKKVWISMQDTEVRDSHLIAHGQEKNIDDYFEVGGSLLMYPGDPAAPPEETINCRCVILGKE